jgi:serine/threonine protein kinase
VTKNGEDVAVKKLKPCDVMLDYKQFRNEFYNLRKLKHENIVQILGYCYETKEQSFIMPDGSKISADERYTALCFEYLHNGSLQKHLSGTLLLHFQYVLEKYWALFMFDQ